MEKPTIEQMIDAWREDTDDFEIMEDEPYDTWRHGTVHQLIVKRLSDETYWSICYRSQPDGEYNSLRDGDEDQRDISQVKQVEKTIITYEDV